MWQRCPASQTSLGATSPHRVPRLACPSLRPFLPSRSPVAVALSPSACRIPPPLPPRRLSALLPPPFIGAPSSPLVGAPSPPFLGAPSAMFPIDAPFPLAASERPPLAARRHPHFPNLGFCPCVPAAPLRRHACGGSPPARLDAPAATVPGWAAPPLWRCSRGGLAFPPPALSYYSTPSCRWLWLVCSQAPVALLLCFAPDPCAAAIHPHCPPSQLACIAPLVHPHWPSRAAELVDSCCMVIHVTCLPSPLTGSVSVSTHTHTLLTGIASVSTHTHTHTHSLSPTPAKSHPPRRCGRKTMDRGMELKCFDHAKHPISWSQGAKYLILPGIEPGIFGLPARTVDRRLIHWATGPDLSGAYTG